MSFYTATITQVISTDLQTIVRYTRNDTGLLIYEVAVDPSSSVAQIDIAVKADLDQAYATNTAQVVVSTQVTSTN